MNWMTFLRTHRGYFFAVCLAAGVALARLLAVLPPLVAAVILWTSTIFFVAYTARELRNAQRFRGVTRRLRDAIDEQDWEKLEAAVLDLQVLLPSANRSRRNTSK